jgi:hypothetical protein
MAAVAQKKSAPLSGVRLFVVSESKAKKITAQQHEGAYVLVFTDGVPSGMRRLATGDTYDICQACPDGACPNKAHVVQGEHGYEYRIKCVKRCTYEGKCAKVHGAYAVPPEFMAKRIVAPPAAALIPEPQFAGGGARADASSYVEFPGLPASSAAARSVAVVDAHLSPEFRAEVDPAFLAAADAAASDRAAVASASSSNSSSSSAPKPANGGAGGPSEPTTSSSYAARAAAAPSAPRHVEAKPKSLRVIRFSEDHPAADMEARDDCVLRAIAAEGWDKPSLVQGACIPHIIRGSALIAQGQSGMGKTGTFAAAALHKIDRTEKGVQAFIIVPAAPLAQQIASTIREMGRLCGVRVHLSIGATSGRKTEEQELEEESPHIIVGTPGRIRDLLSHGAFEVFEECMFICDEADFLMTRNAAAGFEDLYNQVIDTIARLTKAGVNLQICAFSATWPRHALENIHAVIREFSDPERPVVEVLSSTMALPKIKHLYVPRKGPDGMKFDVSDQVCGALELSTPGSTIVFVRAGKDLMPVARLIKDATGIESSIYGGEKSMKQTPAQFAAEQAAELDRFKKAASGILVSTYVTGRGIDIQHVSKVICIGCHLPEQYIQLSGRAGRFGRTGVAITILENEYDDKALRRVLAETSLEVSSIFDYSAAEASSTGGAVHPYPDAYIATTFDECLDLTFEVPTLPLKNSTLRPLSNSLGAICSHAASTCTRESCGYFHETTLGGEIMSAWLHGHERANICERLTLDACVASGISDCCKFHKCSTSSAYTYKRLCPRIIDGPCAGANLARDEPGRCNALHPEGELLATLRRLHAATPHMGGAAAASHSHHGGGNSSSSSSHSSPPSGGAGAKVEPKVEPKNDDEW